MIELDRLTKHYGAHVAVAELSLTVAEGELLVLLGGSGSGKTTTLKMVNRLVEPTSGRVRIDGETALGLRNTFSLGFLTGVVTLDVAHQYLSVADDSQHDIRLTLGVDVGLIGQMLIQFAEVRPG